jgi:HSP20 family protein
MRSNAQLQELQNWRSRLLAGEDENATRLWAPVVDVSETPDEIVLEAELPGMKKDEIEIQLNGDTLVLRGERKFEQTQRGEQFHRIERQYGAWQRSFQIEVPIDAQNVAANYEHGVLTVRLPKAEAVKPRQIAISAK